MRKIAALILAMVATVSAWAQTMNVVVGNVTYAIPAGQAGDMVYASGSTLTILNKQFALSDIDRIYIDNSSVTDGAINVTYNGTSASVVVAGNIMQYVTTTVNGANVAIIQDSSLATEITYTLSGSSTNGSFYMDGSYKATVVLSDLTLTSTDSAAINIENGKRINIEIDGTNTLADASSGSQKGCFMVNGHSEFTGSGSLTITGNYKHGFWGDEYVLLKKKFTGSITVTSAVKDGFNINQYFKMNNGTVTIAASDDAIQVGATDNSSDENNGQIIINGGTINVTVTSSDVKGLKCDSAMVITDSIGYNTAINITATSAAYAAKALKSGTNMTIDGGTFVISTAGKGIWDSDDSETSACAALKSNGNMTITGGTFTLTASGSGGKGISSDGTLTISGGTINITTTGGLYYNNGRTENTSYTGNTDNVSDSYTSSAKGIKIDGNITISGGTTTVTTSGYNAEGIESKALIYITDGVINVKSYDDGINSKGNMYISGGTTTSVATNNDGIDSNAYIYISGGTLMAFGSSAPECSIDAYESAAFYITGGTVLGVGGSSVTPASTTNSQAYVNASTSVSANSTITLKNGTTTIATFTVPSTYSGSSSSGGGGRPGGGSRGGSYVLVSAAGMTSGTSYTLTSGSNSTTATARK